MSQGLREVAGGDDESIPRFAQVVALDECDPVTFNAAVGPDFCRNVTPGAFTTLSELFTLAEAGTPDPGWDFEPDETIKQGTILSVVDRGGEPHTFTEVKEFGNGFIPQLNPGSATSVIPECSGGFKNIAVAGRESFRVATLISRAFRRANIFSNAASIPGCGSK